MPQFCKEILSNLPRENCSWVSERINFIIIINHYYFICAQYPSFLQKVCKGRLFLRDGYLSHPFQIATSLQSKLDWRVRPGPVSQSFLQCWVHCLEHIRRSMNIRWITEWMWKRNEGNWQWKAQGNVPICQMKISSWELNPSFCTFRSKDSKSI